MELATVEIRRGLEELSASGKLGSGSRGVSKVILLGSGFDADVFAFSLDASGDGRGEPQDLVLRRYGGEGGAEKAAREFAAMGRLREAGYPVPRVLLLQCDRSPIGKPFLIMERIHGVSLGSTYWSAPPDRRPELDALLCRLMVRLHGIDAGDILPDAPLAHSRDPYRFVDHELARLSELLGRLEGQEPPSLRDALDWLSSRRSQVPCERSAVVHGDFHPNNILLRADGAPFVIDWSNVRLGDYRTDLAWTRLITRAHDQPDRGETQIRLYEQSAGKEVPTIQYFDVGACSRLLLSTLISLQFGAARQGMRPGAEALMRRDAGNFMRYVAVLLEERMDRKMPDLEHALSALLG